MLGEHMRNVDVSDILVKRCGKVCTSNDIREIFGSGCFGRISRMINSGWILPLKVFKGTYYVLDSDEREKEIFKMDGFEILAIVLNISLGKEWYFGKMTALHLMGAVHQPVSISYVMNKKYRKSAKSEILGDLVFSKTSLPIGAGCGIEKWNYRGASYRVSTPERTMIDYIQSYLQGHVARQELTRIRPLISVDKCEAERIISRCHRESSAKKIKSVMESIL